MAWRKAPVGVFCQAADLVEVVQVVAAGLSGGGKSGLHRA